MRQFLFAFACVFLGLALPPRGLGPLYTRANAAVGNVLLGDEPTASGVRLHLSATDDELAAEPWRVTLLADATGGRRARFPIDLRSLTFLPLVTFIALAAAVPLVRPRSNWRVMALGLALLVPSQVLLTALPILSLLSGNGPFIAFHFGSVARIAIDIAYRALVSPPGMTYAVPLLLFWILCTTCGHGVRLGHSA